MEFNKKERKLLLICLEKQTGRENMEDIVTQTSNVMNKHLNFTGLQKGKPLQQLE